jgi:hypothetical protein
MVMAIEALLRVVRLIVEHLLFLRPFFLFDLPPLWETVRSVFNLRLTLSMTAGLRWASAHCRDPANTAPANMMVHLFMSAPLFNTKGPGQHADYTRPTD